MSEKVKRLHFNCLEVISALVHLATALAEPVLPESLALIYFALRPSAEETRFSVPHSLSGDFAIIAGANPVKNVGC
jgi:hypothetical protein